MPARRRLAGGDARPTDDKSRRRYIYAQCRRRANRLDPPLLSQPLGRNAVGQPHRSPGQTRPLTRARGRAGPAPPRPAAGRSGASRDDTRNSAPGYAPGPAARRSQGRHPRGSAGTDPCRLPGCKPGRASTRSSTAAASVRRRRVAAAQPASARAARPMSSAGPETAQGPSASSIRSTQSGSPSAKPRTQAGQTEELAEGAQADQAGRGTRRPRAHKPRSPRRRPRRLRSARPGPPVGAQPRSAPRPARACHRGCSG